MNKTLPVFSAPRLLPPTMHFDSKARVEFKRFILNSDGSIAKEHPWQKNLIVDSGLDLIADNSFPNIFTNCKLGSTTNPTQRDSGLITFSQAGNTVTASAGFFVSGDVGRLLKRDSGEEVYITVFGSTTSVTVSGAPATLGASQGTVWYVNDTTLGNQTKNTNSYSTDTGDNGSSFSVDTFTHKRTFLFAAEGAGVTYSEIGWGPDAGTAIFGRAVLPSPDTLTAGQQYKVIVRIIVTISPLTSVAVADFGNNGFVTAGNAVIGFIGSNIYDKVNYDGSVDRGYAGCALENYSYNQGSGVELISSPVTLPPFGSTITGAGIAQKGFALVGYTPGSRFRDKVAVFNVGEGNSNTIGGMSINNPAYSYRAYGLKFNADQVKDSNHRLTITVRFSWDRILTN